MTQILSVNKDYARALEGFARCANRCADPDMLLQRFLGIICETQKTGKYLVIRFNELNPDSRLVASSGFNKSQYRQIVQLVDSWEQQAENLPQKLDAFPEMFARELDIHVASFVNTDRQGRKTVLFIGRYNHSIPFNKNDIKFLKTLINIFELALQSLNLKQSAYPEIQKIIDAKQQWESTVDALDVLICLLDEQGKVFRANKTLEKWNLGNVRCLKGSNVHDLLHSDCHDPECTLKLKWLNLWNSSAQNKIQISEFYDRLNQCELRMTLLRGRSSSNEHDGFSTLVIEDTSEKKWAMNVLEEYSEELYSQIQHQTIEINKISTNLQNSINERQQDRNSLQLTEERLLSLSAKLLTAQEEERKRIAAELHDGVGQSISAIKFNLESLLAIKWTEDEEQQNKHHMEKVITRLRDTVEEVRRISMGLRPSMIDELGLLITIQWLCRTFQKDLPAIKVEQELHINEDKISEVQKVSIFRIIQEALNNIAKYSQADRVSIEITTAKNETILSIEDNGIGFQLDANQLSSGFGLCSMKERAKLSAGRLFINTSPGRGTQIKAVWT